VRFAFLADMQLGAYASFSGLTDAEVARYANDLQMTVRSVPATTGFAWDAARYEEAVRAVNALRPDFVLIGGDMVDDPNSEDQYDEFMRITSRIDPAIPVHWVPGNHDVATDTVVPTRHSLDHYRAAFGPDYYSFDVGPLRVVAMNTVVIDHPEEVPDEWESQFDFLTTNLELAAAEERTVVLAGHHPLFKHDPDEDDDYWNLPRERRRPILDLAARHRVPMALAGHWHRNAEAAAGALQMITTGAVGYPLGDDPSGFRVIELTDEGLTHRYVPLGT
jgi:3',5'-cyclic AMP phosphodiesterase CpdA